MSLRILNNIVLTIEEDLVHLTLENHQYLFVFHKCAHKYKIIIYILKTTIFNVCVYL